jgi:hypothetical protein
MPAQDARAQRLACFSGKVLFQAPDAVGEGRVGGKEPERTGVVGGELGEAPQRGNGSVRVETGGAGEGGALTIGFEFEIARIALGENLAEHRPGSGEPSGDRVQEGVRGQMVPRVTAEYVRHLMPEEEWISDWSDWQS